jgi:SAM-dependent methyltransferase
MPGWPDDEAIRLHTILFGYLPAAAVFSGLELGLFDALDQQPGTEQEVAQRLDLADRPARTLLLALLGARLLERIDGRYRNTPVVTKYLVSTSQYCIEPLAMHQAGHLAKCSQLTKVLREDAPIPSDMDGEYPRFGGPERLAAVSRVSGRMMMVDGLAANAPLRGASHLADLGCGSGIYSIALAQANPHLRVTSVERPWFCDVIRQSVTEAGLDDRITVHPGDIFSDRFDADTAMLSNVVEGFGRERATGLLRHVYDWLPPGGQLLFHSHMWEPAGTAFPYTLGLILMLNNTMGGEPYGEAVTRAWLGEVGFSTVEPALPVSPISALVRAVK